ncbi:MAG: hypothetical protein R3F23_08610 [Verrucomicrobiia bacterium]
MFPDHIKKLILEKLQVDLEIKGTDITTLKRRAAEKAVANGLIRPGMYSSEFVEEIQRRAKIIFGSITEVLTQVKIKPYPELNSDLINYYNDEFDYMVAHWEQNIKQALTEMPIPNEKIFYAKLTKDIDLWRKEHLMNIKLFGATIMEPAFDKGNTTILIQDSAVGVFNAGSGTVNSGTVSISQDDYAPVQEALKLVKNELNNLKAIDVIKRNELDEIINDAVNEIKKTQPNKSKLSGLFTVILVSIKGVEVLEKAYVTILHFLEKLGIVISNPSLDC